MSTSAPEYLTTLRDGFADAVQQWMDQSTSAWDQWARHGRPAWRPQGWVCRVLRGPSPGTDPATGTDLATGPAPAVTVTMARARGSPFGRGWP